MSESLRSKTLQALSWSFIESVASRTVQFAIGVVLARLLFPEQFGLIGMLSVFMAVAQTFLDSGFGAALIQRREATVIDTCSIFYFNIAIGFVVAGLLCLTAPWIADFFGQPILVPLTRILSLTVVINSFGLIQSTILIKQINFKTETMVSLTAVLASGSVGIVLAMTGFGVWSLAVQQVGSSLFRTILLWLLTPWRPELIFNFGSLKRMFGFGSRVLSTGLIAQVFDNIYVLIIGKLFSATDLGFFTRAQSLQGLPTQALSGMVARVAFPVFSSIQDDKFRLKKAMKKALKTLCLVHFPMMVGLLVIARPLVLLLLTEKWTGSILYLQLLCIVGLLYPVHVINLILLQALGRSDLSLRLEVLKKLLIVISVAITWRWGITVMIYGMIAVSFISYYLNSYYAGLLIDYAISDQVKDFSPYLIMAIVMGMVVYGTGLLVTHTLWLLLIVQMTIGFAVYVGLGRLFRPTAFIEVWQAGRDKVRLIG
jgi:teichuronic acid exporter